MSYILSIDQGTSSSRAVLFSDDLYMRAAVQEEFDQIYPKPGWVEHNPNDIILTTLNCIEGVVSKAGITYKDIETIGITNQRETVVAWDAITGKALCNAIVWQCRRTADRCKKLNPETAKKIHEKTGLFPDPYFSATKMEWMLENLPKVREASEKGTLRFGTVDSWLIWNLTPERLHLTDYSNASRTMLFNINTLDWDDELLEMFGIKREYLPRVVDSSKMLGKSIYGPIISGVAGDQQASLFGQTAFEEGDIKCTYGTGAFMLMNTGNKICLSENGLLTTIGWRYRDKTVYALEGSIFATGALITWLKDGLKLISSPEETETLAKQVENNGGVYFNGGLAGLGAPRWDSSARGLFIGMSRATTRAHMVRAVLECIAFSTRELIESMQKETGIPVKKLLVDGGVTKNNFLMELQSKVLGVPVDRSVVKETTALGAAMLAGIAVGIWEQDLLKGIRRSELSFMPDGRELEDEYIKWKDAVERSTDWVR